MNAKCTYSVQNIAFACEPARRAPPDPLYCSAFPISAVGRPPLHFPDLKRERESQSHYLPEVRISRSYRSAFECVTLIGVDRNVGRDRIQDTFLVVSVLFMSAEFGCVV